MMEDVDIDVVSCVLRSAMLQTFRNMQLQLDLSEAEVLEVIEDLCVWLLACNASEIKDEEQRRDYLRTIINMCYDQSFLIERGEDGDGEVE